MNLSANSNRKRNWFELPHDKTNKMTTPFCPFWSEPWLCTQCVAKDPSFLHADSEDSDQTARMPGPIWVCCVHNHFTGFVMRRLIYLVVASFSPFLQSHTTMQWLSSNPTDTNFLPSAVKTFKNLSWLCATHRKISFCMHEVCQMLPKRSQSVL